MSRGEGDKRTYSAEALIAEAAVAQGVIAPAKWDAKRGMWHYGMWDMEFWLPEEVFQWADCPPVGPDLVVPGVTLNPMPLMWVSDMGAEFALIAKVLVESVSG